MASLPLLEATVRSLMGRPRSPASPLWSSALIWVCDGAPSEGGSAVPRAVRNQRQASPPAPGLLTDAEIARALRRFRYDPEFRGLKRIPIRAVADLAGLSHMTLYEAMRPDLPTRPRRISEFTRAKLSPIVTAILEGRTHFRRKGKVWMIGGTMPWQLDALPGSNRKGRA